MYGNSGVLGNCEPNWHRRCGRIEIVIVARMMLTSCRSALLLGIETGGFAPLHHRLSASEPPARLRRLGCPISRFLRSCRSAPLLGIETGGFASLHHRLSASEPPARLPDCQILALLRSVQNEMGGWSTALTALSPRSHRSFARLYDGTSALKRHFIRRHCGP